MNKILKYTKANVRVSDVESGCLLFTDSNLFLDSGRAFIADSWRNAITTGAGFIDGTKFACDFGDDSETPAPDNIDLASFITDAGGGVPASIALAVAAMSGEPTGLSFTGSFSPIDSVDIRELGLFYRNIGSVPAYVRGAVPATDYGVMIARLRTTYGKITVGAGKSIAVEWKIIF